jgi:hypothetical protein
MEKVWRIYEVIDCVTGELLKKEDRKNYITVSIETTKNKINGQTVEITRRIVKHNGQTNLFENY